MKNDLIIRNMVDTINHGKLKENTNISSDSGTGNSVEPNELDRKEELEKFGSQITSRVDVTNFLIYPKENNVTFGGSFTDIPNFTFVFDLKDVDGVKITTNNVQLNESVLDRIKKLRGYYLNWAEEWANKIINEYRDENI